MDDSLTVNDISGGLPFPGVVNATTYAQLDKFGAGQLILPNANTYLGPTEIESGWVTIGSSGSLGVQDPTVGLGVEPNVTVESGAALHLLPLAGNITLTNNLILFGSGITNAFYPLINQEGAIENLAGINNLTGNVGLADQVGVGVEQIYEASDPTSPNYSNPLINNVASQLTAQGTQYGAKPVVTISAAPSGSGGITEFDQIINVGATAGVLTIDWQAYYVPDDIRIYYGPVGTPGSTLLYDSSLTGVVMNGNAGEAIITVNFNDIHSVTTVLPTSGAFGGPPATNIKLGPVIKNYGPETSTQIEIIINQGGGLSGTAWNFSATLNPIGSTPGGINKLGSQRLIIQGPGTFTGNVNVEQGVVLDENDTGLGSENTTTVNPGTALELGNGTATENGGIAAGIQTAGENLVLNGSGNPEFGDAAPLVILPASNNTIPTNGVANLLAGPFDDPIVDTDQQWGGNVSLNTEFQVQFQGTLGGLSQPTLTASAATLTGTGPPSPSFPRRSADRIWSLAPLRTPPRISPSAAPSPAARSRLPTII